MEKYVAVDSGKYATKYAYYDEKKKEILKSKFRTKISPGRMDDDEIEAGTFIAEIEQIQISVEKFPLNILKVPAWYFEKAAVKKPEPDLMPENVSFVQMSIFDIIGTY